MKPATERFGAFNNKNIGRTDANIAVNAERSVYVFRRNQRGIWGGRGGQLMLIYTVQVEVWAQNWHVNLITIFEINN